MIKEFYVKNHYLTIRWFTGEEDIPVSIDLGDVITLLRQQGYNVSKHDPLANVRTLQPPGGCKTCGAKGNVACNRDIHDVED